MQPTGRTDVSVDSDSASATDRVTVGCSLKNVCVALVSGPYHNVFGAILEQA